MNNETYENQQNSKQLKVKINEQKQQSVKIKLFNDIMLKSIEAISRKMEISWKDWVDNLSIIKTQTQHKQQKNIKDKKEKKQKPQQKDRLKLQVKAKNIKKVGAQKPIVNTPQSTFTNQPPIIRKRTRSQNNNQLKSLKKTNEQIIQHQEQEKKLQRLKQITKRKLQLMDRLKKIDSQLIEAKRQGSPIIQKNNSFFLSNLQKSSTSNLNISRLNKPNENVVEQHYKIVEKLQKINNQKIKRQQKIAEQFKKKQQIQIMKVQQLQNKRKMMLQQKSRKNQLVIQKLLNDRKNKNSSYPKINQLPELGESSMIPMTMVHKTNDQRRKLSDGLFLQGIDRRSSKNLLTQRDADYEQTINKQEQEIKNKQTTQNQIMNQIEENYNENQFQGQAQHLQ